MRILLTLLLTGFMTAAAHAADPCAQDRHRPSQLRPRHAPGRRAAAQLLRAPVQAELQVVALNRHGFRYRRCAPHSDQRREPAVGGSRRAAVRAIDHGVVRVYRGGGRHDGARREPADTADSGAHIARRRSGLDSALTRVQCAPPTFLPRRSTAARRLRAARWRPRASLFDELAGRLDFGPIEPAARAMRAAPPVRCGESGGRSRCPVAIHGIDIGQHQQGIRLQFACQQAAGQVLVDHRSTRRSCRRRGAPRMPPPPAQITITPCPTSSAITGNSRMRRGRGEATTRR